MGKERDTKVATQWDSVDPRTFIRDITLPEDGKPTPAIFARPEVLERISDQLLIDMTLPLAFRDYLATQGDQDSMLYKSIQVLRHFLSAIASRPKPKRGRQTGVRGDRIRSFTECVASLLK